MNVFNIAQILSDLISHEPTPAFPPHTVALRYLGVVRSVANPCGNLRWDFTLDGRDDYVISVGDRCVFFDLSTYTIAWEPREPTLKNGPYPPSTWREVVAVCLAKECYELHQALESSEPSGQVKYDQAVAVARLRAET